MGNHFHLLLETPEANLSGSMHWIDSSYAGYFNRVHGHVGHVFQGRFEAILVDREAYLLELCRYIVLNPVRAFMVEDPALYPWSSFRETAGIDRRPGVVVSPDWILSRFGEERREAALAYARFVRDGLDRPSPLLEAVAGTILGDAEFRRKVRERVLSEHGLKDIPALQLDAFRPSLDEIFPPEGSPGMEERDARIRSACRDWLHSRTEVARHLGLSVSRVGRIAQGQK